MKKEFLEKLSIADLQTRVNLFDTALKRVHRTSSNLGTKDGSQFLRYGLSSLSELEASTRVTKVTVIRGTIINKTIINLGTHRQNVIKQIEFRTEAQLRKNIEFVRSRLGQGGTQKELEFTEQLLQSYLITKDTVKTPASPIDFEIPNLTPAETELLELVWETSKQKHVTGTDLSMTIWGDEIRAGEITIAKAKDRLNVRRAGLIKKLPKDLALISTALRASNGQMMEASYYLERNSAETLPKITDSKQQQLKQNIDRLKAFDRLTPEEMEDLEKQIRQVNPNFSLEDGSTIQDLEISDIPGLTTLERKALEIIWNYDSEKKTISADDWAEIVYKEAFERGEITFYKARDELRAIKRRLEDKIKTYGLEIINVVPKNEGRKHTVASYYLKGERMLIPVETVSTEITTSNPILPTISFYEDSDQKFKLKVNERLTVNLGYFEAKLVETLYNNPEKEFTSEELWEILKKAGSKSKNNTIVVTALREIEKKLDQPIFKLTGRIRTARWSLPRQIEEEIIEEEKQRRQKLMETINSFILTTTQKRVLEVAISYSWKNPGSNADWAIRVYGEEIPIDQAIDRLDNIRRKTKRIISSKIQIVSLLYPQMEKREAGYFLRLVEEIPSEIILGPEKALPKILFDSKKRTLQTNSSPVIKLGEIEAKFVEFLYNNPNKEFKTSELFELLKETKSKAKGIQIVRATLKRIEEKLGQEIFQLNGHSTDSRWSLPRQVEVV